MDRKQQLYDIFEKIDESKKELVSETIENTLFLEEQLQRLRKFEHIKIHPDNPSLQKRTEAGKLYKEYLQQYTNCIKLLSSILNKNLLEDDDEFMKWSSKS